MRCVDLLPMRVQWELLWRCLRTLWLAGGYLNCSMGGGGGEDNNFCIDVQNDVYHCGQCGNDCTHGFSSAIKQASCVKGVCDVVMQSPLEWEMCFGNMSAGVKRDGDKSAATVAVGCFRGYDFLVVFCCAFPLFVVSLVAFVRIRMTCRQSHMYRQALFLLIALISCLRMSYAVAALIFLGTASTPEDAVRSREFFSATMISLNAYADLFTGFIDLLLTVYWLFVLDRVRTFPKRLLISVCIGMSVVLTVATIVDYASGTSTFDYTFFTLAILLFFTALMHMSVIAEVLIKFVLWSRTHSLIDKSNQSGGDRAAEVEQSFKGSFPAIRPSSGIVIVSPNPNGRGRVVSMGSAGASVTSVPPTTTTYGSNGGSVLTPKHTATPDAPSLQQQDPQHLSGSITSDTIDASLVPKGVTSHFVRVTLIAFVCLLCWMVRSVMLLGRATRQPIFVEGALSFRSSTFTLLYLTLLTLFPCVLIAVIFLALSVDVLRAATVAPGSASSDKTNEDDGASSSHHRAIDSGYRFSPRRMSPRANTTVTPPTLTPSQEERPLLREEN
ncbi:transmembrane protein, putative [Bodo saltans]|uniref:Transmembrane protein, putative n=1 Tax=Bodo saltans TaxID=75058 RepID=A0A0S4JTX1_BODSA|nr:transmembrane protein, putative [Bodo saltans]|eukprot:CUG92814.1 transmembrane protein, putative [Bodo saltans]